MAVDPIQEAHDDGVDVLYITYNQPDYVRITLPRLCETVGEDVRLWVWHNGDDAETLQASRECSEHPRVHRFHHSPVNGFVREPTNWMWGQATGALLGKVDDDGYMPDGWVETLREAHQAEPRFGVVGSWRAQPEDFDPALAGPKIRSFGGGKQLLSNLWVEGSGYLMKRACLRELGLLAEGTSFTEYCIGLAKRGWVNGWHYPFVEQEDLDDPRSPHSPMKTDSDLRKRMPLGALKRNIDTIEGWVERRRQVARELQTVSDDVRRYQGWRNYLRRIRNRAKLLMGTRGKAPRWNQNW